MFSFNNALTRGGVSIPEVYRTNSKWMATRARSALPAKLNDGGAAFRSNLSQDHCFSPLEVLALRRASVGTPGCLGRNGEPTRRGRRMVDATTKHDLRHCNTTAEAQEEPTPTVGTAPGRQRIPSPRNELANRIDGYGCCTCTLIHV